MNNWMMEDSTSVQNTTHDFLRSFSILSDGSDFDDLEEPESPGDYLDNIDGKVEIPVRQTELPVTADAGKHPRKEKNGKRLPFSSIHKASKGFQLIRPDCWMNEPIKVEITKVDRKEHPHRSRKAFNPNLYTIEISHGEFKWTIKRRYKHFDNLHNALRLFRARCTIPVPTKRHRERRQSFKDEMKERKIKKKQSKKISRFPKKPEFMIREDGLEKRKKHLEQYLQSILESKWYRNHTEVLKFMEVSELSFVNHLGKKWQEGEVMKCSGGRRISIGCCGALKKYHLAGWWSKRWLVVKDTFIGYIRPSDGIVCEVMLMDSDFKVESGMEVTGALHGLLVTNQSRHLLAKCYTRRKADEWEASIKEASVTTGKEFTQKNRYDSYAPVRDSSYARWFVDGSSYFEAVADALMKAKEEIFITDWWLSPEIYLKRRVADREKWRLDAVLKQKAQDGVKVFVILYKELEIALTINSHYSKHQLMKLSENIKVIRHPDHVAGSNRVLLWAHHEKMVIIDQKTAFIGGLDLCYGRWDDEEHRMTDLGSVTYGSIAGLEHISAVVTDTLPPSHNGPHLRKLGSSKVLIHLPSTVMESPESNLTDSGTEDSENLPKHIIPIVNLHRSDSAEIVKFREENQNISGEVNLQQHLKQEFSSGDNLTENDSLKNADNVGYRNVLADITVHIGNSDENITESLPNNTFESKTMPYRECNTIITAAEKSNEDNFFDNKIDQLVTDTINVNMSNSEMHQLDKGFQEVPDIVVIQDMEEFNKADHGIVDINCVQTVVDRNKNVLSNTDDVNSVACDAINDFSHAHKNEENVRNKSELSHHYTSKKSEQTKNHAVQFNENTKNQIEGDVFERTLSMPVEKTVFKSASERRESWAARKLRHTFNARSLSYGPEDSTDGTNQSASVDSTLPKFRHKWRLVLNIKKLEHGGKKPEDGEILSSHSSYAKQMSPHISLSSRIRHSMPFLGHRQGSDEDYYSLYPWKRAWTQSDESNVKSVMKSPNDDGYNELEGQSKLWIGKDYVNFIHKDPVDVHNPFEDFIQRDKTPRMPWHDIGGVVYGNAARDVARHFIQRWNFCKSEKFKTSKEFPVLVPKSYSRCEVSHAIRNITYPVRTQVLRSTCGWSSGIQNADRSIHNAYIDCISRAEHYIYIENQFFISQVNDRSNVRNEIADALVKRIEKAYNEQQTFRVYVVLPLLPAFEGEIGANGGYAIQAILHWNYKSISKGENSIWQQLQQRVDDPKKYILFCGLRAHAELKGKLVTELVYVHSKLMIVDDNTVIIGSANINDRSLLGTRDSELAVLFEDTKKFPVIINGKKHMAGQFATSLRRTLFREHLGIKELDQRLDLIDPVCDTFFKNVWLDRALKNTTVYYKVFKCIPDDTIKTFKELREMASHPPLAETDPSAARQELMKIQGRVVLMPLHFLENEESIMATGPNKEAMMPMKLWL